MTTSAPVDRGLKRMAGDHVFGESDAWEENIVDSGTAHPLRQVRLFHPEADFLEAGRKDGRQRRSPTAAADNREGFHLGLPSPPRPNVTIRSLPSRMRPMFS